MNTYGFYVIYLFIILAASIINLGIAVYAWRHRRQANMNGFVLLMANISTYGLFNFLVIVAPTEANTLFVAKIGYISVTLLPVAWLSFVVQYTGRTEWMRLRNLILISLLPAITFLLTLTNDWHSLIWSRYQFSIIGTLVLFNVTFGTLGWVFYIYVYAVFLTGIVLLLRFLPHAATYYQKQIRVLIAAALLPFFINMLYVYRIIPEMKVDFTALGFSLSGCIIAWSLVRNALFEFLPMARNLLVEKMREGVIVLAAANRVIDLNLAAQDMLGIQADQALGKTLAELLPDWQIDLAKPVGEERPYQIVSHTTDGKQYDFELGITPLPQKDGSVAGWLIILRDISARRQTEDTLQQRVRELEAVATVSAALRTADTVEEMLSLVVSQTVQVIHAAFGSIYLLEASREFLTLRAQYPDDFPMVGLKHQLGKGITGLVAATGKMYITLDVTQDPMAYILPEEENLAARTMLRSQISLPLQVQDETFGVMHLGLKEERPFTTEEIRLTQSISDIAANAIHRAMVVSGLEEEVAIRTSAIRAEEGMRAIILNSVQDAILMTDLHYTISYINPAFTTLTGYTPADLLLQNGQEIWTQMMDTGDWQALYNTLAQANTWQGEVKLQHKSGRTYDAALIVTPVQGEGEQIIGYVFSHYDITQRKELDRARNQFMKNVSHELRTPVTNIHLYTDLLHMAKPEKRHQYLQVLTAQSERLAHLVQDILEMTALDSGGVVQRWQPISLPNLVNNAVQHCADSAQTAQVTLIQRPLPQTLPIINGDEERLSQALVEIIMNAIIFSPLGGVVTVTMAVVQRDHPGITITVEDSGPGIPTQEQDRIFDRFYRGTNTAAGNIPGTGLGLSIVDAIIRAHRGEITVKNNDTCGSCFTIWLPQSHANDLTSIS